jgi:hypothetical protein
MPCMAFPGLLPFAAIAHNSTKCASGRSRITMNPPDAPREEPLRINANNAP